MTSKYSVISFRKFIEAQAYTDIGHGAGDTLWFWKGGRFYQWDSNSGIHASAIEQILTPEEARGLRQMRREHEEEYGEDADWVTAEQYLEAVGTPYSKGRHEASTKVVTFINFPPSSQGLSAPLLRTLYRTYGPDIKVQGFGASGRRLGE
jgi:hypothetical protein